MGSPDNPDRELMTAPDVARTISRMAHQIIEKTAVDGPDAPRVVLLGIPHLVDARIHHETTHDAIVHSGRPTRSHDTTALL